MPAEPKICILYDFRPGPWGGGNQFLKALRTRLVERGIDEPDPSRADAILVNSHQWLARAAREKWRDPAKTVIHRLAGPLVLSRPRERELDVVIRRFNRAVAAGTVFQSQWARQAWLDAGLQAPAASTIAFNAPDPAIFNREGKAPFDPSRRTRLIATSWSPNPRKGFDVYAGLDESLDFERFEMTFVGNSPSRFRNIRMVEPLPSAELAGELRRHDVYVTASRVEACPNSLLEAMHCGLPALALDDGSHPELVGRGGEIFTDLADALEKLDRIAAAYPEYQAGIDLPSIDEVADRYVSFVEDVHARRTELSPDGRAGVAGARALAAALEQPIARRGLRLALGGRRRR